jgi:hypothetical protein
MGFIQMKTVQRVYREVTDNGTVIERETTHMDISFIPFRWLSSRGQVTFIDKHYDAHNRSFWTYNPRIYNRVSNDSMIIQACEKKDIGAIRTLFQYRQASPFDTCSNGSSLMKQAIGAVGLEHDDHYWGQALEVIRFLISQGADPATFMAECLEKYHECSISCWAFFGDHEHQDISTKGIDEIWGFCLSSCQRDPFTDTRVLEMLWDHSLGGQCLPRVDPASLFHDTFTGFENLVFENPDKIFSDLMEDATSLGGGPLSTWRTLIDQKYQTMAYLCSGGSESIKERTFSGLRQDSASTTWQEDSCFCPETSSHLLFKLLYRTRLWKRTKNRQDVLQNHVYRMLILLFQSGEDPQATCACTTRWQRKGEFRTATDVAASEGILGVWRDALEASGFDATAIIDEWQFDGIPLLYEMPSLEPRPLMAPLRLVGNAVHLALSSFV